MRADSAPSEVVQIVDDSLKQALAQKEDEVARLKSALEELAADTVGQTASEPSTAALEALQREISTKNDEIQKLTAIIDAMPQAQEPQDITDAAELVRGVRRAGAPRRLPRLPLTAARLPDRVGPRAGPEDHRAHRRSR